MSWMRLRFAPGIVKDKTQYSADGYWYDCNLVRFRQGLPEKWKGWQLVLDGNAVDGRARSISRHSDLDGQQWLAIGTHLRFYICSTDRLNDVTPVRSSGSFGTDPFTTTVGTGTINVNLTSHGVRPGDYVIIAGSTDVGGIPADIINDEHTVARYVDDDNFEIDLLAVASSSATGGGASATYKILYTPGTADQIQGGGWGSNSWGLDVWGGDSIGSSTNRIGLWTQSPWGEDLIANISGQGIFYWDRTNPDTRMVNILDLAGADGNAPEVCDFILTSQRDRHLIAFGCTGYGVTSYEPMTIRWCSQENILDWNEASTTGTAGSIPLSSGSRIIAAANTSREIVIWTDTTMYSMAYIGAPYIYGVEAIGASSDICGLNAHAVMDDVVYWMGRSGIYRYSGRVEEVPCPIFDWMTQRIDWTNAVKIYCSTNRMYSEIIWFYPTDGNEDITEYAALNTTDGSWTYGRLDRTVWLDMDSLNLPYAVDVSGYVYAHEIGADDGSDRLSESTAINAYIESAPLELSSEGSFDKGDKFMFIRRIIPDVSFRSYSDAVHNPEVNLTITAMDKPGNGLDSSTTTTSSQVSKSVTIPVQEFTDELHVRLRGRAIVLRVSSDTRGTLWRLGVPRIDVRTDGQR